MRLALPLPALVMPPRLTLSPVEFSEGRDPDSPSARADFETGSRIWPFLDARWGLHSAAFSAIRYDREWSNILFGLILVGTTGLALIR